MGAVGAVGAGGVLVLPSRFLCLLLLGAVHVAPALPIASTD